MGNQYTTLRCLGKILGPIWSRFPLNFFVSHAAQTIFLSYLAMQGEKLIVADEVAGAVEGVERNSQDHK